MLPFESVSPWYKMLLIEQALNNISFLVKVPVLSEKIYLILPKSSWILKAKIFNWSSLSGYNSLSKDIKKTWANLTTSKAIIKQIGVIFWKIKK